MPRLKLLFTLLFVVGLTLTNCSDDVDCGCGPYEGPYFDIQGIKEMIHYRKRPNTTAIREIPDNAKIAFKDYAFLSLNYLNLYHSARSKNLGLGELFACSCPQNGILGSKNERYHDITVVTMHDFDSDHLKNDTINDILLVNNMEGKNVNEYLTSLDTNRIDTYGLAFYLPSPPKLDSAFQVRVKISLSTGEVYEKLSPTVIFTKE